MNILSACFNLFATILLIQCADDNSNSYIDSWGNGESDEYETHLVPQQLPSVRRRQVNEEASYLKSINRFQQTQPISLLNTFGRSRNGRSTFKIGGQAEKTETLNQQQYQSPFASQSNSDRGSFNKHNSAHSSQQRQQGSFGLLQERQLEKEKQPLKASSINEWLVEETPPEEKARYEANAQENIEYNVKRENEVRSQKIEERRRQDEDRRRQEEGRKRDEERRKQDGERRRKEEEVRKQDEERRKQEELRRTEERRREEDSRSRQFQQTMNEQKNPEMANQNRKSQFQRQSKRFEVEQPVADMPVSYQRLDFEPPPDTPLRRYKSSDEYDLVSHDDNPPSDVIFKSKRGFFNGLMGKTCKINQSFFNLTILIIFLNLMTRWLF